MVKRATKYFSQDTLVNGKIVKVDSNPGKPYSEIAAETNSTAAKRVLQKLDGCDKVWNNDEKNQVAANVGFVTAGLPVLAFLSLLTVLENAALKPLKRAFGYKNKGCDEDPDSEDPDDSDSEDPDDSDDDCR